MSEESTLSPVSACPATAAEVDPSSVTVVIPAYQGGDRLLDCIRSLQASTSKSMKILIVDNASTDGSIEKAEDLFAAVEVQRNPENAGFGAACNRGIEIAMQRHDSFVLLINQDTTVAPEMIERLVTFADHSPQAGVVGPKTLSTLPMPNGSPRLLYGGAWRTWLPLWQRIPDSGLEDSNKQQPPIQVDYVWGHGMLLRVAALRNVGSFDPGFFMYYEDIDLCTRMIQAGWQVWCVPDAVIWHDMNDGARASKSESWRWEQKVESMLHFYHQRSSLPKAIFLTFATIGRESISLARHRHFSALIHLFSATIKLRASLLRRCFDGKRSSFVTSQAQAAYGVPKQKH